MKKYNTIIFDLDGTLVDTSEGIINCYNNTAIKYQKNIIPKEKFKGIIGCPLYVGFTENYNMNDEEAKEAVIKYRKLYNEVGIYESNPYDGISELLKKLKNNGYNVAVATLKLEKFAKLMLKNHCLDKYIDIIYGPTESFEYKKSDLLNMVIKKFNISKSEAVLIGDSFYDSEGAKEAGIDFIGVTYGLGYSSIEEIKQGYHIGYSQNVENLFELIENDGK